MSRVGYKEINIPDGVQVEQSPDLVTVKGKNGTLTAPLFAGIKVNIDKEAKVIRVDRESEVKMIKQKHGLVRSLINNAIEGVTNGFSKILILEGVGYKASMKGSSLILNLGYSHDIEYKQPDGVKIEVLEPTKVKISGGDKQRVGQVAADIREFRKPEPYKGKGIRYEDERIRRKAGKAGKK